MANNLHTQTKAITTLFLVIGLVCIAYCALFSTLESIIIVALLPLIGYTFICAFRNPVTAIYVLFILNYFLIAWMRYTETTGRSVWLDILFVIISVMVILHSILMKDIPWKLAINCLTLGGALWAIYCLAEILNPRADIEAWIMSRSTIYNILFISVLSSVLFTEIKQIRTLLFIFSILSAISILKVFCQRYIGFDTVEQRWLDEEGGLTHLIASGTRYFSIFTDAGNFGSNMGLVSVLFGILSIFVSKKSLKIYYLILSILGIYALLLSGTRGALAVPLGGLLLFSLVSKNFKLMTITTIIGLSIYIFFAHTNIGQGNQMIRRMRTTFRPTQDASFNVRKENQKKVALYLKDKPFGEGLGLSGGNARRFSSRLTANIPNDSTYVKIWVETGIVGLILFLTLLILTFLRCCYIIMFRIKDKELRGMLMAMLCGIFGLMISAYGNAFFNQFPTQIIVFAFFAIILNGPYLDQKLIQSQTKKIATTT